MILELHLTRLKYLNDRVIGTLDVADFWRCWTLEDRFREIIGIPVEQWKVPKQTAIPMGRYRVVLDMSQRFGKVLPRLLDVPGYTGVRIHTGNTDDDTEGCILVGDGFDQKSSDITQSRAAMGDLMDILIMAEKKGDEIWITVK